MLIIIVNIISLSFVKKQNKNLEKKSIEINNRLDVIQSQKAIVIENNTFYPINKVMESIVTNILMYDTIYIIIDQIPNSLSFGNTGNSSIRALIYPNMFYDDLPKKALALGALAKGWIWLFLNMFDTC